MEATKKFIEDAQEQISTYFRGEANKARARIAIGEILPDLLTTQKTEDNKRMIKILDLVKDQLSEYHCGEHKKLLSFISTTQESLKL